MAIKVFRTTKHLSLDLVEDLIKIIKINIVRPSYITTKSHIATIYGIKASPDLVQSCSIVYLNNIGKMLLGIYQEYIDIWFGTTRNFNIFNFKT